MSFTVSDGHWAQQAISLAIASYTKDITNSEQAPPGWSFLSRQQLNLSTTVFEGDYIFSHTSLLKAIDAQAVVSINDTKDTLSIAIRGTAGRIDALTDLLGALYTFRPYYAAFEDLFQGIDAYISNNKSIKNVLVTGHSLGGSIVELYLDRHPPDSNINYLGYTFGSPGNSVTDYGLSLVPDPRLVNVLHAGDPVANVTPGNGNQGFDVTINRPDYKDHATVFPLLIPSIMARSEHASSLYDYSVQRITRSLGWEELTKPLNAYNIVVVSNPEFGGYEFLATSKDDFYLGGLFIDKLYGGGGNDILDGGSGSDEMFGGIGNDALIGGRDSDILDGGPDKDKISGGEGADRLIGGGGHTSFWGGSGDDVIDFSGSSGDLSFRTATRGITVDFLNGFALDGENGRDTFVNWRNVRINFDTTKYGDKLLGSDFSDSMTADLGNDTFNGRGGIDTWSGAGAKGGVVVNLPEPLSEGFAEDGLGGRDLLISVENADGSRFNDSLTGSSLNNVLRGLGAIDKLLGLAGDDTLDGGDGSDLLNGGKGKDIYVGGGGADTYRFGDITHMRLDEMWDFSRSQGDKIDLSLIDANIRKSGDQAFHFIAKKGMNFDGTPGALVWSQWDPDWVSLRGDVNGDRKAEFSVGLFHVSNITADSFIL